MKKLDAFGFFNDISNCNKIIVYARDNDDFNNIIQKMTDLFIEMCDRPVNTVSERAKIKNLVMQKNRTQVITII